MAEPWKDLGEKLKELVAPWTTYVPLGSVALYLVGYLALRFHLTALGIGTDLAVLDERYLFTGAKFLVYLVSSVPSVGLVVLLLVPLIALPYWLVSCVYGAKPRHKAGGWWQRILFWWTAPTRLLLIGIVLAVVLIQFVMRQCFVFSNLLLAQRLPPAPAWLYSLLLDETDGFRALFFAGLVAGTAVTSGLGLVVWRQRGLTTGTRLLLGVLAFLVGVQFLLLPVNYGILIADKTMPRVVTLGGSEALRAGQDAWLVWEGKDGVTYLVRGREGGKEVRKLVTLLRSDVKKTELTAYDPILRVLFATGTPRIGAP